MKVKRGVFINISKPILKEIKKVIEDRFKLMFINTLWMSSKYQQNQIKKKPKQNKINNTEQKIKQNNTKIKRNKRTYRKTQQREEKLYNWGENMYKYI